MTDSVQPDNRSALQVAIEQALDKMVADVDAKAPLPQLFDGLKTPIQFLPSLAIERGVADWSADDSEYGMRDTVSTSLELNSLACTRKGIVKAISSLGFLSDVIRIRPYVLSVVVHLSDQELTYRLASRLIRRAKAYKAARDSIDISLSRSIQGIITTPCTLQFGNILTIHPYVPVEVEVAGRTFISTAVHNVQTMTIFPGGA
ncbi:MAG: phage tail protein [Aeromonas sp.]